MEGKSKSDKPTGDKRQFTIRITGEGSRLLAELAKHQGISRTAVLELLIRQEAERRGVE